MVKKDKKWEWIEKQEKAFEELKRRFTEELVLVAPDLDKKMRMEVDASVLWQPLITKTNDYTNGKSLSWISSGEFTRELDKESLLD